MCFNLVFFIVFSIVGVNINVSDKNNKFYDCVNNIKAEKDDLDKIHTAESNISINQNIGWTLNYYKQFRLIRLIINNLFRLYQVSDSR